MRVSLVARFVSHPSIDFGSARRSARRPHLGLQRDRTIYHRPRHASAGLPTIRALRSQTSRFRFQPVGRLARLPARRAVPPFGLPRVRRG
jgi:hypothetical protein